MNSEYIISFLALLRQRDSQKPSIKDLLSQYSNNIDKKYIFKVSVSCSNLQEQITAEEEGEEQFVLLKERATHVTV